MKSEAQLLNNKMGELLLRSKYGTKTYLINQMYCQYLINKGNYDILHPTYYDPYFILKNKKPLVITIHDMTHERLPEYFWSEDRLTYNKRLNIEAADQIIAISETTKKDLIEYSNVDENKIKVIYHGIDLKTPLVFSEISNLPKAYFLYVGDRGGYKNFYLFLNAFHEISDKYPEVQLLLTGGGQLAIADQELISRLKLQIRVRHINVSDEELNSLYKNAIAFVYPSLHEGFGLPILEAFKAKCPVILSDTECFKEIGASAVNYFSTYEKDSLIVSLEKMLNDSDERQNLIEKGSKRLMDFPMDNSINQTYTVYNSLK